MLQNSSLLRRVIAIFYILKPVQNTKHILRGLSYYIMDSTAFFEDRCNYLLSMLLFLLLLGTLHTYYRDTSIYYCNN